MGPKDFFSRMPKAMIQAAIDNQQKTMSLLKAAGTPPGFFDVIRFGRSRSNNGEAWDRAVEEFNKPGHHE